MSWIDRFFKTADKNAPKPLSSFPPRKLEAVWSQISDLLEEPRFRSDEDRKTEPEIVQAIWLLFNVPETAKMAAALAAARPLSKGDTLLIRAARHSDRVFETVLPFSDLAACSNDGSDALFAVACAKDNAKKVGMLLAEGAPLATLRPPGALDAHMLQGSARESFCALAAAASPFFHDSDDKLASVNNLRDWPKSEAFWMIFDALKKDPSQASVVGLSATPTLFRFFDDLLVGRSFARNFDEPRDDRQLRATVHKRLMAELPLAEIISWAPPEQMAGLIERSVGQSPAPGLIPQRSLDIARSFHELDRIGKTLSAERVLAARSSATGASASVPEPSAPHRSSKRV
jgi:hypothetical protein